MKSSSAVVMPFAPRRPAAPKRSETEFLPAALEIVETPASPAGRAISLSIVALVLIAIVWAAFGKVDVIATAQGRLIPSGKSKVIQPFETGVVRAISVRDGDAVKAGDTLVELDPADDASDIAKLRHAMAQAELDAARLKALIDGKPDALVAPLGSDAAMVAVARRHAGAQADEQTARLAGIDRQIDQKKAEGLTADATIEKIKASLPLLHERRDIRAALMKKEYGSRMLYLEIQQQVVEMEHELNVQTQHAGESAQAVLALGQERAASEADYRKKLYADLAKADSDAAEHRAGLVKAALRKELRTLRAPMDGTVEDVSVHTIGGVVTAAQQLMIVVPSESTLEIEATLANSDVGFVREGQEVAVKIETFDFTRYGLLHGKVKSISRNAIPDEKADGRGERTPDAVAKENSGRSARSSYVARIAIDERGVNTELGFTPLRPGMSATAEIKTGRRTVLDYLLSPLEKVVSGSFTER